MSRPGRCPEPGSTGSLRGLLEKLMAAVRPEFRADVLAFDPADPVFGGPRLPGGRLRAARARSRGLCSGHHERWHR